MTLYITQRFEKLCRAILASMEAENEPKVSVLTFYPLHISVIPTCDFCLSDRFHTRLSGLVCVPGSLQRPHYPLAQADKGCAVDLLSATEKFKGLGFEVENVF